MEELVMLLNPPATGEEIYTLNYFFPLNLC